MNNISSKLLAGVSIFIYIILSNSITHAVSMEILSFTGTINYSSFEQYPDNGLGMDIKVGDPFSGYLSFIYDPLLAPEENTDHIYHMQYSYSIAFDNFSFSYGPTDIYLSITNTPELDYLSFWSMPDIVSNGQYIEDLAIGFGSSGGNALAGTGLPPSIDSTALDFGDLYIIFGGDVNYPHMYPISGEFDTITACSVPVPVSEPGTMFLGAVGLVGLAGSRIRKKKK